MVLRYFATLESCVIGMEACSSSHYWGRGRIRAIHRTDAPGQFLETIPRIGALAASALAASIGNARAFRSGRELAAWLGLVPRQNSSGGTPRLLGISKRGDSGYPHGSCHARDG